MDKHVELDALLPVQGKVTQSKKMSEANNLNTLQAWPLARQE